MTRRRFSEGMEMRGETPEKAHLGHFSDGLERRPSLAYEQLGRFSLGQGVRGSTPRKEHRGRFSEGQNVRLDFGRAV